MASPWAALLRAGSWLRASQDFLASALGVGKGEATANPVPDPFLCAPAQK